MRILGRQELDRKVSAKTCFDNSIWDHFLVELSASEFEALLESLLESLPEQELGWSMGDLIVFGDSLCDGGNAYALRGAAAVPCPPHWQGRRCNGPVWVEQLAVRLQLPPLRHSLAGGSNHAYGGARSGAGLSPKGMPNLLQQVERFLGGSDPGDRGAAGVGGRAPIDPDALVVVRAGANDYLDTAPSPAVAAAVNAHLLAAVQTLAGAGLRRFLVPSELPWGYSPIELPGVVEADRFAFNGLIADQNAKLQAALTTLASKRGLELVQPDFHRLFLAVRANPAAYGFDQIDRPVLQLESLIGSADGGGSSNLTGTGSSTGAELGAAADRETPAADGFLWWDSWAHFTTAFHRLLAQEALAALVGQRGSQVIG